MADKYIYVRMIKQWSRFVPGDVVRFGWNKGMGRINAGEGERVPKQDAVNGPSKEDMALAALKAQRRVENAMAEPKAEKAVVTPIAAPFAKAEVQAKAKKNKKGGKP